MIDETTQARSPSWRRSRSTTRTPRPCAEVRAAVRRDRPGARRPGRAGAVLARARRDVRRGGPDDPGAARRARGARRPVDGTRTETLTFSADRLTAMVTVSRVAPGRLRLDGGSRRRRRAGCGCGCRTGERERGRRRARAGSASTDLPEGFGQLSFHPVDDDAAENAVVTPAVPVVGSTGGHAPSTRTALAAEVEAARAAFQQGQPRSRRPAATRSCAGSHRAAATSRARSCDLHARVLLGLAAAEFEVTGELDGAMALLDEAEARRRGRAGRPACRIDPGPARPPAAARRRPARRCARSTRPWT